VSGRPDPGRRPSSDPNTLRPIAAATESSGGGADRPCRGAPGGAPFTRIVLLGLGLCIVVALIPGGGALFPLQLAVATALVLVLPGAVILRVLGWPSSHAAALPICVVWSVTALAPGFMLMLAVDGGLVVPVGWLLAVVGFGLLAGRGKPVELDLRVSGPLLWSVGGVLSLSALVWLESQATIGDAIEHVARVRKITELDPPGSLEALGLLPPETGLHPGYGFPLWHAAAGVVTWISGAEEARVFEYWPAVLVVFVVAAVYRAGSAMFNLRAAGAAVVLAYLALYAFPNGGVGYLSQLSYPGYISIFLLWPVVIERTFTYLREGGREPLLTAAAASFVVSAIHPSYVPFMILLPAVFLVARTVMARHRQDLRRLGAMLAAVTVPFLLFLLWLFPVADSASATVEGGTMHFSTLLNTNGDLISLKPEFVTRGGAAAVAGLLLVPLLGAAVRTRAAAFVVGTSVVIVSLLILPWLFTPFADLMSVSQARRLVFYLPLAFALAGGALLFARFRVYAVGGALALGVLFEVLWPGDFQYQLTDPGPGWVAWFAAVGGLAAVAVAALSRLRLSLGGSWVLPIVAAFVLPVAATGIHAATTGPSPNGHRFDELFLSAVEKHVGREDVVLADLRTAYRLTANVPVYVVAVNSGHGGDTVPNRHTERRIDVSKFFDEPLSVEEAWTIVRKWDADWIVTRTTAARPRAFLEQLDPVYRGRTYTLYSVEPRSGASSER
jgi:hypothetical protein